MKTILSIAALAAATFASLPAEAFPRVSRTRAYIWCQEKGGSLVNFSDGSSFMCSEGYTNRLYHASEVQGYDQMNGGY